MSVLDHDATMKRLCAAVGKVAAIVGNPYTVTLLIARMNTEAGRRAA